MPVHDRCAAARDHAGLAYTDLHGSMAWRRMRDIDNYARIPSVNGWFGGQSLGHPGVVDRLLAIAPSVPPVALAVCEVEPAGAAAYGVCWCRRAPRWNTVPCCWPRASGVGD